MDLYIHRDWKEIIKVIKNFTIDNQLDSYSPEFQKIFKKNIIFGNVGMMITFEGDGLKTYSSKEVFERIRQSIEFWAGIRE